MRAFAGVSMADLDPFVHMDQMGEVDYAPGEPKGTAWHPHRGFETVTYMIDGTFQHQDSHGGGGVINDGATQWMTAGAGILHIETPPEALVMSGGIFHGLQLWVNLPAKDKFSAPRYQAIEGEQAGWSPRPTAARSCASSPARSAGTAGRARPTRRSRWPTPRSSPARSSRCRGSRSSTRSVYVLVRQGNGRAQSSVRSAAASLRCFGARRPRHDRG